MLLTMMKLQWNEAESGTGIVRDSVTCKEVCYLACTLTSTSKVFILRGAPQLLNVFIFLTLVEYFFDEHYLTKRREEGRKEEGGQGGREGAYMRSGFSKTTGHRHHYVDQNRLIKRYRELKKKLTVQKKFYKLLLSSQDPVGQNQEATPQTLTSEPSDHATALRYSRG